MTNKQEILKKIRQYVMDVQNDEEAMVIEQEMAQDILNILNGLPAYTRGEELLKEVNL